MLWAAPSWACADAPALSVVVVVIFLRVSSTCAVGFTLSETGGLLRVLWVCFGNDTLSAAVSRPVLTMFPIVSSLRFTASAGSKFTWLTCTSRALFELILYDCFNIAKFHEGCTIPPKASISSTSLCFPQFL